MNLPLSATGPRASWPSRKEPVSYTHLSTSLENAGSEEISELTWANGVSSLFTSFITRIAICENGQRLKWAHGACVFLSESTACEFITRFTPPSAARRPLNRNQCRVRIMWSWLFRLRAWKCGRKSASSPAGINRLRGRLSRGMSEIRTPRRETLVRFRKHSGEDRLELVPAGCNRYAAMRAGSVSVRIERPSGLIAF